MSGLRPERVDSILTDALAGMACALLIACALAIILTSWWAPVLGGTGWLLIESRRRLIRAGGAL